MNKLKRYRQFSGLTQEAVAELMKVTKNTISNWECSNTTPDIYQGLQLAQILQVNPFELFYKD